MADNPSDVRKPRVKVEDLVPRKDACGGGGLRLNEPPLPIPPPGFIKSHENPDRADAPDGER